MASLPARLSLSCWHCSLYGLNSVAPGKTKLLGTYQEVAQLVNHYNGSLVISSNPWCVRACVYVCFTGTPAMISTLVIIG